MCKGSTFLFFCLSTSLLTYFGRVTLVAFVALFRSGRAVFRKSTGVLLGIVFRPLCGESSPRALAQESLGEEDEKRGAFTPKEAQRLRER